MQITNEQLAKCNGCTKAMQKRTQLLAECDSVFDAVSDYILFCEECNRGNQCLKKNCLQKDSEEMVIS